jgi:hypothetical protein
MSGAALALAAALFFDDFSQPDLDALRRAGWVPRSAAGHPGPVGARWEPSLLGLLDDPAQGGNRLLRLRAATDGSAAGTQQSQLCHRRQYLEGSYAARVRFVNTPAQGVDGDPVIQAHYLISPLRHDLDPDFSEVDFEYLANGGWASAQTRLYAINWQTVQIEPWRSFNQAHERPGALESARCATPRPGLAGTDGGWGSAQTRQIVQRTPVQPGARAARLLLAGSAPAATGRRCSPSMADGRSRCSP